MLEKLFKNKSVLVTPVNTDEMWRHDPDNTLDRNTEPAPSVTWDLRLMVEDNIDKVFTGLVFYKVISTACRAAEHIVVTKFK